MKKLWTVLITLVILSLTMSTIACGGGGEQPNGGGTTTPLPTGTTQTEVTPRPTTTPRPTPMLRDNPLPGTATASVLNWDVRVLESKRGDAAWQDIKAANRNNEAAPQGMEYLLVKLHVKCNYSDDKEHLVTLRDFAVTGDRLVEYSRAPVVPPEPLLYARLTSGQTTEGWAAYLVGQGEGNLMLVVSELLNPLAGGRWYIALDEGASITVAPELSDIAPTDIGKQSGSPAALNQAVTTEDWQVTLLEVQRGDAAWGMVQQASQDNSPPEAGMEYIAAKVRVRSISTVDQPTIIDAGYFSALGSDDKTYESPSVELPEPALYAVLFPGGQYEGWVVLQVPQGKSVVLVFAPPDDETGVNKRYLSLGS